MANESSKYEQAQEYRELVEARKALGDFSNALTGIGLALIKADVMTMDEIAVLTDRTHSLYYKIRFAEIKAMHQLLDSPTPPAAASSTGDRPTLSEQSA